MKDVYRALALPVYLPSLFIATAQQGITILLPLFALELGAGPEGAALVLGLRGVGTMLVAVPAGVLAAKFGDRAIMAISLALMAVAAFGLALTHSIALMAVLALGFGVASGAWMLARMSYITAASAPHERGRVVAVVAGIQRFGMLAGPLIGGSLVAWWSYDVAFFAATSLSAIAWLLVVLFTRRDESLALAIDGAGKGPSLWRAMGLLREYQSVFLTAGLAAVALSVVRHGRPLLIPLWGAAVGLDEAAIGVVFSVAAAIDMAMFYPAGQLIDRRGRRWALLPCLLVLALALALLPLAVGFWSLLAIAALSGFGNGIGTGIVMTLGSDFSPENRRGEFLGVWRLVADLGGAFGPFAIGGLAAAFGLALATLATAAVGVLGAAVTLRWVPETLHRPVRPVAAEAGSDTSGPRSPK